ncbi:hypothetical protein F4824DRAFT_312872 [Ustulina deusta]|nr:hypothetical protein F4824DRAFT_312872 [Ustulina deusta]
MISQGTLLDLLSETRFTYRPSSRQWWDQNMKRICKSAKVLFDHGLLGPQGRFHSKHQDVLVNAEFYCALLRTDSSELWATLIRTNSVFDVHRRNRFDQTLLAQIDFRQCGGNSLQWSSWKPNLLRALVKAGSDLDTIDSRGLTPFHYAILYGDFNSV